MRTRVHVYVWVHVCVQFWPFSLLNKSFFAYRTPLRGVNFGHTSWPKLKKMTYFARILFWKKLAKIAKYFSLSRWGPVWNWAKNLDKNLKFEKRFWPKCLNWWKIFAFFMKKVLYYQQHFQKWLKKVLNFSFRCFFGLNSIFRGKKVLKFMFLPQI